MQAETRSNNTFILIAFFFEAGLGVAAIAVGWLIGFDPLAKLPTTRQALPLLVEPALWGLLAAIPMFVGLLVIKRLPFGPFQNLQHVFETRLLDLFMPLSAFELAAISIAAGFGEEALFRGLLQAGLAEWIGPPNGLFWAVAVASLVFGVCHWITPTYAALAALTGLYLGVLMLLTDSLLAPIIAHGVYDFAALIHLTREKRARLRGP